MLLKVNFKQLKKSCKQIFTGFFSVESPRFELGSKQVTKRLSTRLFFSWVFDYKLVKDNPFITYLL